MQRETISPRGDWQRQFEDLGFNFHSLDGLYWDESACYRFSATEIDMIEEATWKLHELCIAAVDHVITQRAFEPFALPGWFIDYAVESWNADNPTLFGRFDFRYDGMNAPKLLEYNADTPTSLIETAVAQWNWQQQVKPRHDQFNSLHERLIGRWKEIREHYANPVICFACVKDNVEDFGNAEYLRDTAIQAGINTRQVFIEDIGWHVPSERFVDLQNNALPALFKLYPWEWMAAEEFGQHLPASKIPVIEPAWKVLMSSKAILPVLWELNPGHPNLLPCYYDQSKLPAQYVRKPIYSREGANVELHTQRGTLVQPGTYGAEGYVYQAYAPLPDFDGNFPVIGSWIVDDEAAGIGIRENTQQITTNTSRFVPHYFS
ncbi:MAG TPA: glutathionylspermidine synthase family protein [Burkholderiales bacterium]|nr:glutathionylspermidine synthase family protein [Burkholderiales bacterium]